MNKAIQIICNTLGEEGVGQSAMLQFLLVITLVKVKKAFVMSHKGEGRGKEKLHQMSHRGGWSKTVTYYFKWPLNAVDSHADIIFWGNLPNLN